MAKNATVGMWRRAIIVMLVITLLGFGIALASVFKVAIIDGKDLQIKAISQSLRNTSLSAKRGTVYDANETILAESASVWTVILEPAYIKDDETRALIAKGLSKILDMDEETILEKTKLQNYYTYLKRKIETDTKNEILEFISKNKISRGIVLEEAFKRYYPNGSLASVLLGFTGTDNQGLAGLEAYYDKELSGTAGKLVAAKNALGTNMPFEYEQNIPAIDGYNLTLTIDATVQAILEKNLEEGIINNKVVNGAVAIAMDVKTGAIKGMAIKQDFDPNDPFTLTDNEAATFLESIEDDDEYNTFYNNALQAQWRNKAVNDTYYPGSVFKMVTGSVGMEEGLIDEESSYYCSGAFIFKGGSRPQHCWKSGGHHSQTFVEGLCNSCNPFFIHIGQMIGADKFFNYSTAFGLTSKTGIDLPGESNSIFFTKENLNEAELATLSYGQNFSITPLQMITACAAISNGGYILEPYVVAQIKDADGNIISTTEKTVKRQVISEEVSERMSRILQANATTGTGKNGYVAGYRVAGKTGTSEKVAKYWEDTSIGMRYIASYCGFAPADDPQYALLVLFDEPLGHSYYGGAVAGPVFAKIMEEILPYLGVEKQYNEEELENISGIAPDVTGMPLKEAKESIGDFGLDIKVLGEGDIVIDQIPYAGEVVPNDTTVVVYTDNQSISEKVEVPKFIGLTLYDANSLAAQTGLQIKAGGAAVSGTSVIASAQNFPEGTMVRVGTIINVTFAELDQVQ